jgi:hypothetical protein
VTFGVSGRYAIPLEGPLPHAWDRDGNPIFAHESRKGEPSHRHVEIEIEVGDEE